MLSSMMEVVFYLLSMVLVMYGLQCVPFDRYIRKNHVKQFYAFYFTIVMILTYLLARFFIDFTSIRF